MATFPKTQGGWIRRSKRLAQTDQSMAAMMERLSHQCCPRCGEYVEQYGSQNYWRWFYCLAMDCPFTMEVSDELLALWSQGISSSKATAELNHLITLAQRGEYLSFPKDINWDYRAASLLPSLLSPCQTELALKWARHQQRNRNLR
jgi:hypothetical protein